MATLLDPVDLAIIAELQRDGRMPLSSLARKIGVSHGTVRTRIDRLLHLKAIRIVAVPDPPEIGFTMQVIIGINGDLAHMTQIEQQLAQFEELVWVATVTGRLDFVVVGAFSSTEEFRRFLSQKLAKLKGIRRTEIFSIMSFPKRVWDWQIRRRLEAGHQLRRRRVARMGIPARNRPKKERKSEPASTMKGGTIRES